MPYYIYNIKKGKYQVEMLSDDKAFAANQVDRLFQSILNTSGRARVTLPPINPEKVIEETKQLKEKGVIASPPAKIAETELKETSIEKDENPEPIIEKEPEEPKETEKLAAIDEILTTSIKKNNEVKSETIEETTFTEEIAKIEEPKEIIEKKHQAFKTNDLTPISTVKLFEIKETTPSIELSGKDESLETEETELAEITEYEEESIEPTIEEKIVAEIEEDEEVIEEFEEVSEEVEEEFLQQNLFENILAQKTLEISEEPEIEEEIILDAEEQPEEETPEEKEEMNEEIIVPAGTVKQKAGFKKTAVVEEEPEIIKPKDVISPEDEEIAKILEEKIKKSIPQTVLEEEPEETSEPDDSIEALQNKLASLPEEISKKLQENLPKIKEIEEGSVLLQEFEDFEELVNIKKPQSKIEYLLLATYFLQTKENLFKYSLKQINSKVMPVLGALIDHSVIHEAVSQDFIEVVPDYNGTAEVTEYKLTSDGENYILS